MTYTSTSKYIDINTGEVIRWPNKQYIKIKTNKDVKTNYREGKCTIEYTILCDRNRQGKLFN